MKITDFQLRRADTGKSFCMEVIDRETSACFCHFRQGH